MLQTVYIHNMISLQLQRFQVDSNRVLRNDAAVDCQGGSIFLPVFPKHDLQISFQEYRVRAMCAQWSMLRFHTGSARQHR